MTKKRAQWRLPKTFRPAPLVRGSRKRHDGEPQFRELVKHGNDRTLIADAFSECCGCGLTHHRTFTVMRGGPKWWLIERAYKVPGTGGTVT